MNIITGMISPLMNCALNDDSLSRLFCSAKVSATSRCRPKTVTSSCPE
jgi:hypothetical protein